MISATGEAPSRDASRVITWQAMESLLAALMVFFLGTRIHVVASATPGLVIAILVAPLWLSSLRRTRGAVALFAAGVLAVVSGVVLTFVHRDQYQVDASNGRYVALLLLGVVVGAAALSWARTRLAPHVIGLLFGSGVLISSLTTAAAHGANPWKFTLAVPVAMIVLSLAGFSRLRRYELIALPILAVISAIFDSRSYMATFVLAWLLVLWQLRPRGRGRSMSAASTVALLAAMVGAIYYLAQTLLLGGALGQAAQERTLNQIDKAGNLILGGRPELTATLALIRDHPEGFGFGVIGGRNEILIAKTAMESVGYDTSDNYVENFMFGRSTIELHSVLGDIWATCGLLGFPLLIAIAAATVLGLAHHLARGTASALILFLGCWTLWNLCFSPLLAAAPTATLLLGMVLPPRDKASTTHPPVVPAVHYYELESRRQ